MSDNIRIGNASGTYNITAGDDSVIQLHREWTRRLEEVFGAPADVPLQVAAELDGSQMAWRRSEGDAEDPGDGDDGGARD